MNRRISQVFSKEGFRHLIYIPIILVRVRNWWPFLLNYIGLRNDINEYSFRNGDTFTTIDTIDVVTLMVVYIKRDYGVIPKNSTEIDIGANIGAFTVYAASKAAKVIAIEPVNINFDTLNINIQKNELTNKVVVAKKAVTNENGVRKIYISKRSAFHSFYAKDQGTSEDVECLSLDTLFFQYSITSCDILKIDAEDSEYDILYAASADVLRTIKNIRVEVRDIDENNNIRSLAEHLHTFGFVLKQYKLDFTLKAGIAHFINVTS